MKDFLTYEVGDIYTLYGAGPDCMSSVDFTVEFVNEKVAIAHLQSLSAAFSYGLNIEDNDIFRIMSHDEVKSYMGDKFNCLSEHDVFLDMNYDPANYQEIPLYDVNGESINYRIIYESEDFRAKCGEQALNHVCLIKAFGIPQLSTNVIPLTSDELSERELAQEGNYYWYIQFISKKYRINDWVDIRVENPECDYGLQYEFEGYIVYSHNNWAVMRCTEGFATINGEHPYRLINYDELSAMPGFTAHFEHYEGVTYVLIEQETGETSEAFMPYIATMPDGEALKCSILGYKYLNGHIVGRYVTIEENDAKEGILNRYPGFADTKSYLPNTDDYLNPIFYFPLKEGETITIVHD